MTDIATDVLESEVFETPTQPPTDGTAVSIEPPPARAVIDAMEDDAVATLKPDPVAAPTRTDL